MSSYPWMDTSEGIYPPFAWMLSKVPQSREAMMLTWLGTRSGSSLLLNQLEMGPGNIRCMVMMASWRLGEEVMMMTIMESDVSEVSRLWAQAFFERRNIIIVEVDCSISRTASSTMEIPLLNSSSTSIFITPPRQTPATYTTPYTQKTQRPPIIKMKTFTLISTLTATLAGIALAAPSAPVEERQVFIPCSGLYGSAQCCATDVLGIADLDCGQRKLTQTHWRRRDRN